MKTHKAGFVNIIGNPNVGKSSIMNILVGERISIVTSKSQTTRHRIMGIVNEADYQIVYSDTPGILVPNYKLQETMMKFVDMAITDADVIMYVTDVVENFAKNKQYIEKIKTKNIPVLLIINKIDLSNSEEVLDLVQKWKDILPQAELFATSAKAKFNVQTILTRIVELLPPRPPYFAKDELTDKPVRFFISEIIREKIMIYYKKEVPYSTEIAVDEYKDEKTIVRIKAIIYVLRESQKAIILGNKGESIKKVGTKARIDIENFLQKKVFLELYVKVNKDWRENEQQLQKFGYN